MIEKNLKKIVYKFKISQLTNNDEISATIAMIVLFIIVCTFQFFQFQEIISNDSYDGGIIEFDIFP